MLIPFIIGGALVYILMSVRNPIGRLTGTDTGTGTGTGTGNGNGNGAETMALLNEYRAFMARAQDPAQAPRITVDEIDRAYTIGVILGAGGYHAEAQNIREAADRLKLAGTGTRGPGQGDPDPMPFKIDPTMCTPGAGLLPPGTASSVAAMLDPGNTIYRAQELENMARQLEHCGFATEVSQLRTRAAALRGAAPPGANIMARYARMGQAPRWRRSMVFDRFPPAYDSATLYRQWQSAASMGLPRTQIQRLFELYAQALRRERIARGEPRPGPTPPAPFMTPGSVPGRLPPLLAAQVAALLDPNASPSAAQLNRLADQLAPFGFPTQVSQLRRRAANAPAVVAGAVMGAAVPSNTYGRCTSTSCAILPPYAINPRQSTYHSTAMLNDGSRRIQQGGHAQVLEQVTLFMRPGRASGRDVTQFLPRPDGTSKFYKVRVGGGVTGWVNAIDMQLYSRAPARLR